MASGSGATTSQLSRLETKLESCLASGDYYEAHQIYRTLYYRLTGQCKYDQLLELLYNGSRRLIGVGQPTSGVDLAELFVETLCKSTTPVSALTLDRIEQLFARMPATLETDTGAGSGQHREDRRSKFLNQAVKWSTTVADKQFYRTWGHPDLHLRFAVVLWAEHNYEQSRSHFILSDDGEKFATFLIEFHQTCGFRREVDLFVSQAVLQILCHKKRKTAEMLFYQYAERHPDIRGEPPYQLPLLNFIWLLLLCISVRKVTHFSTIIERYQPSIRRDPSYTTYLDKIGQLFFGIPPPTPRQPMGGMFANLLQGLMGRGDGDTSATDDHHSSDEDDEIGDAVQFTDATGVDDEDGYATPTADEEILLNNIPPASCVSSKVNKSLSEMDLD